MDLRIRHIKILWLVFAIYLAVLLRITMFRSGFELTDVFSGGEINAVPVRDLIRIFLADKWDFIYLFFGNIIWFVPFGFLLKKLTPMKTVKIVFLGFLMSLFIETMQFIFGTGVSDIDDLILNTIGALTGTAIASVHARIKQ